MNSLSYDIERFINRVKDDSYDDMVRTVLSELNAAERVAKRYGRRRRKSEVMSPTEIFQEGASEYARVLNALLAWLRQGIKTGGISDQEFLKFQPICENLVKTNQFNKSALSAFDRGKL